MACDNCNCSACVAAAIGQVGEPEYPDVLIYDDAVAVQFDERAPYFLLTPDGAVSERYTLGGVA
jgi:hypothetical protein